MFSPMNYFSFIPYGQMVSLFLPYMVRYTRLFLRRQSSGACRFNPDWLMESELVTLVISIKDVVRSSVKVPEFDKHLKKAGGHIDRNVIEITIKKKTIVPKPVMIKNHQASSQKFRKLVNAQLSLTCKLDHKLFHSLS